MNPIIALFPLNTLLLPEGKMRLRLFEPRYLRMMKEASSGQRPFAMASINPLVSQHHADRICPEVTLVSIIDFEQLPDGLLGITVEGLGRYQIIKRWQEQDQLHVAELEPIRFWTAENTAIEHQPLWHKLQLVFKQYPELARLYPEPEHQNLCWLVSRWMELLPLTPHLKRQWLKQDLTTTAKDLEIWLEDSLEEIS
ncbi:LON peptidase substrate-binding domain-containing protein [uncultured Rheinheimera sp.]|jgi:Lon protease-like protein|uniref:LON peptidase substrate-binding domain-containing protein n=1 Tax=uncultured Rheinheimera sp. TaxID=400532 RepID=UPI002598705B|nr:LON peptidase substrate-binding domain-containing protein [uncultured Rheinheimera sp.]